MHICQFSPVQPKANPTGSGTIQIKSTKVCSRIPQSPCTLLSLCKKAISKSFPLSRFTIYTNKGKKYGPFGDRRSEESVDFDVSAPPGHALAYISGTVDFGVPLRSLSLHWRPFPG